MAAVTVELLLRLALVGAIYLFLLQLLLAIRRDTRRALADATDRGARLVVIEPGASALTTGEQIPVWPATILGRAGGADVRIDDLTVSSRHARVVRQGREWWIEDLGSTNGTRLNGRPVRELQPVADGDLVDVGRVRFRMELHDQHR